MDLRQDVGRWFGMVAQTRDSMPALIRLQSLVAKLSVCIDDGPRLDRLVDEAF